MLIEDPVERTLVYVTRAVGLFSLLFLIWAFTPLGPYG